MTQPAGPLFERQRRDLRPAPLTHLVSVSNALILQAGLREKTTAGTAPHGKLISDLDQHVLDEIVAGRGIH